MEGTEAVAEQVYLPPEDFREDRKDPLLDIHLDDSKELWLIQWPFQSSNPYHLLPDVEGQEFTVDLNPEGELAKLGQLGSLEGQSGKKYTLVSPSSQETDATVFLSSRNQSKIVGRISRLVSVVHYPDGAEIEKEFKQQQKRQGSSTATHTRSSYFVPQDRTKSRGAASTYSSKKHRSTKSSLINSSIDGGTPSQNRQNSSVRSTTSSGHTGGRSSLTDADGEEPSKTKKRRDSNQSQSGATPATSGRSGGHSSLSEVSERSTDKKRKKSK